MAQEQVPVTEWTKSELERLKEEEEHTSFDSVIRTLLGAYNP